MGSPQMPPNLPRPCALRLLRFVFFVGISISCLAFRCNGACQVFKCGKYSLDFPFGKIYSDCGDPALQLDCDDPTGMPLITIGQYQYYILKFYNSTPTAYPAMVLLYKSFEQYPCNISESVYDQFWSAKHFLLYESEYSNMTLGVSCSEGYGGQILTNTTCNGNQYFTGALPDLTNYCTSEFRIPVNKTEQNLGTSLPQIIKEGVTVGWTASEDCTECAIDSRNCTHLSTLSFCYCDSMSYSQQCSIASAGSSSKKIIILGSSIGGGLALVAAAVVLFLFFRVKRRNRYATRDLPNDFTKHKGKIMEGRQPRQMIGNLPIFSFEELQQATDFFDEKNELGDGGFGAVYLGKLMDGRMVAVKKLFQQNSRRIDQFINEVEILANMNHPNLVRLYGCTQPDSPVLLLVYEFLPNGTLADHLNGSRKRLKGLPWSVRLNIAIDVAQALAFLHNINPPVFHRDVKSTNILLDEYFRAKVADFGLSRLVPLDVTHITTAPQGTPGYVDPEYHECFQLTDKSDVYSFGVVLMELISAKLAVDVTRQRNEICLAIMAVNKIKTGALQELVDPDLGIEANPVLKDMVTAVAELAFNCLANNRDVRPDMREVTTRLEQIKELNEKYLQEQPDSFSKETINPNGVLPPSPTSVQERWPSITSDKSS